MKIGAFMPGITSLKTYNRSWLKFDVIAGVVLATLLVPQGMAYAELAGLPAITGLYTSILCLIGYALFGPSRILVLGPDSSLGPMIAATILPIVAVGSGSAEAVALASLLAIIVGVIMVVSGAAKLGFVADLLSKPTQIGYMNGLAVTILVGQLPKLLGFSTDADGLISEARAVVQGITSGEVLVPAMLIGFVSLAVIFILKKVAPKVPSILVAVVVAIIASVLFSLGEKGVSLIGVLPEGLPSFTIPDISHFPVLFAGALGIALVALTDTISTSSAFAARSKQEVNGSKEMIGIGAANIAAGFFQGFPVSTSGSRTAVAERSGAKTQLAGIVGAAIIVLMLVLVPGLMKNLPQPTLGAVVIAASLSLADIPGMRRLWKQRRSEFVLALVAFLGVALVGVLEGIAIAVVLSILRIFHKAWWPYSAVLGYDQKFEGYHDVTQYKNSKELPGLVIFRFDAQLFFANANNFKRQIKHLLKKRPEVKWIIIAAEPITDIDTTAADMLANLDAELNEKGVSLVFAELKDPVKRKMERYELVGPLNPDHFFPTLDTAIKAYQKMTKASWKKHANSQNLLIDTHA